MRTIFATMAAVAVTIIFTSAAMAGGCTKSSDFQVPIWIGDTGSWPVAGVTACSEGGRNLHLLKDGKHVVFRGAPPWKLTVGGRAFEFGYIDQSMADKINRLIGRKPGDPDYARAGVKAIDGRGGGYRSAGID